MVMILSLVMSPDKPSATPSELAPKDDRPPAVREMARREAAASKTNWTESRHVLIKCKSQMQADKGSFADCVKGVATFSSLPPGSSCRMQFEQVDRYLSERTRGNADSHLYEMASIHYDGCLAEIDSFIADADRELSVGR